jgi:hypothetical protein
VAFVALHKMKALDIIWWILELAFCYYVGKGSFVSAEVFFNFKFLSLLLIILATLALALLGGSLLFTKKVFTLCSDVANYAAASRAVKTVPKQIWHELEGLVAIAVSSVLALAEIGCFLASWIVSWTLIIITSAPYFTIAALILSIFDPSFAPHACSLVMIQIFLPLMIPRLTTISVIARVAAITFPIVMAATMACGAAAVLIVATGTWIALATVFVAMLHCAMGFFPAAEPAPSPELDDEVELNIMYILSWIIA